MANHDRTLDPESLKKEHAELVQDIEEIELIQEMIGQGDLSYAPAFGLVSSGQNGKAYQNFGVMHETSWTNLDAARRAMYAGLASLEDAMERHGISEFENVRSLDELNDKQD